MGDLNSGVLTLIAFAVLALFGLVAYWSLRKHIRGIEAPTAAEMEAEQDASEPDAETTPETPARRKGTGHRSPKASSKS